MPLTIELMQDYGPATGSPAHGTPTAVTDMNWKGTDSPTADYAEFPISAPGNSFTKWNYLKITGANRVFNGQFSHLGNAFPNGAHLLAAVGQPYSTPSQVTHAGLTNDLTAPTSSGSELPVLFGPGGPEAAGKVASATANPAYSEYMTTQLQCDAGVDVWQEQPTDPNYKPPVVFSISFDAH